MERPNQTRSRRGSNAMMNPPLTSLRGRRDSSNSMPLPEFAIGGPPLMFASRARSNSQTSSLEELRMFRSSSMAPRARATSTSSTENPLEITSQNTRHRYPSVDEERILKGEFAL